MFDVNAAALVAALAEQGLSCRAVAGAAAETPDLHRLSWREGGFWHRCPHGGESPLEARDLQSAAAEFTDAVQADRAMIARLYVETASTRAFPPPPPKVPLTKPAAAALWAAWADAA